MAKKSEKKAEEPASKVKKGGNSTCTHVVGQSILGSDKKLTQYCGLCGARIK